MSRAAASLALAALLATGCSYLRPSPQIKTGAVTVTPPEQAGSPATLVTASAGTTVPIPAGSRVTVTKFEAVPFRAATVSEPAQFAAPAREVTEIIPGGATEYRRTEQTTAASTGTVDTSLAARKIDAEESRVLLYAAMACMVGAGAFFWMHYPSPAMLCAGAAIVLFLAWKVSNLPPWFYALAVAAVAIAAGIYFGHERAEKALAHKPTP